MGKVKDGGSDRTALHNYRHVPHHLHLHLPFMWSGEWTGVTGRGTEDGKPDIMALHTRHNTLHTSEDMVGTDGKGKEGQRR